VLGCWEGKRAGDESKLLSSNQHPPSQKRLLVPEHTERPQPTGLACFTLSFFFVSNLHGLTNRRDIFARFGVLCSPARPSSC